MTKQFIYVTIAILIASLSRLIPHADNFTPIAAMALFGGTYITNRFFASIVPLISMFFSDLALELMFGIGFHATMLYVYFAFLITTSIGFLIRKKVNFNSILTGTISSAILFFLITNFGYWAVTGFGNGILGLSSAYIAGLPFFRATVLGDLIYSFILFGSLYLVQIKNPSFNEKY
jgi:hypothetical protein